MKVPVPFPPRRVPAKYGFGNMAIGDSFFVATEDRARVATAAAMFGPRHGMRFSVRRWTGEDEFGYPRTGYRCWRIG